MAVKTPNGKSITKATLRRTFKEHQKGAAVSVLERSLGVDNARGKWLSRAWKAELEES